MKFFTLILFLGISVSVFSQDNFDKRLLEKYSQEQLNELAVNQPQIVDYWTFYLDNSYEIIDIQAGKSIEKYPEIKFKSADKFNVFELDSQMQKTGKTHYRIKNSNLLLVLDSKKEFIEKYNAYRANN